MGNACKHWDQVYTSKAHDKLSWHQDQASISLEWILEYTNIKAAIIDVGTGVSVLSDNLLDKGYQHLSLLELSSSAIQVLKTRLKNHAERLTFYNENILDFQVNQNFDLWHDRAVFHFLTDKKDQKTYINKLRKYLKTEGYFLLATFAPTGPQQSSELDIVQYDKDKMTQQLEGTFQID